MGMRSPIPRRIPRESHANGNSFWLLMGMGMGIVLIRWDSYFICENKIPMERNEMADYVNMNVSRDTAWFSCGSKRGQSFPNSAVFRRMMCIPASSAASQRVFSIAGRRLEKRRTSLCAAISVHEQPAFFAQ